MLGLMQDWPMTVDRILDHAQRWHGDREIVSRSIEGPIVRTSYGQIHERAKRFSGALLGLGVQPGDRIGVMAWNTARHMEAWYGIMGIGAICHTINPRLFAEQICYIINHAGDRILLADPTFLPVLYERRAQMPNVEHIVALTDEAHIASAGYPGALCFETLVEQASPEVVWGGFDENTACGLCYTSGTTGNPKGVLYSHRSNFLHTLVSPQPDVLGLASRDVIMPIVPMYHANAWGLAFSAPAIGAKLVMPGARMDGQALHELLETEAVTFAGAVPTVWQNLFQFLRESGEGLSTLKRVLTGGSALPEALLRTFNDDYGIEVIHIWGMTETSPIATGAGATPAVAAMPREEQIQFNLKQGRPSVTIDLKLTDDEGRTLPRDGQAIGHLKVRGPYVIDRYFGDDDSRLDQENFFDTGDVAAIDPHGYVRLTDRAKDVIKSGGEWISSIDLENLACGHPKTAMAAVIGVAHPKWDERPLLLVKLKPGETATREEYLAFLEGRIARWWTPDEVLFVDDIPLGATGKIDKKQIRQIYADYVLPNVVKTPH